MILSVSTWQVNPNMNGERNSLREPEPSSVSTSPSAQSSEPRAPTILVVDDDLTIGPWVRGALEPLGYVVLPTADPSEAIQMGKDRPGDIDMLLVDVVMPLMDGRKLAQRLRALRPRLKVVFMSGYGLSELEEMGAPFIVKPFGMDELAQMVAATLRNEAPASPPRQGQFPHR
jgi:two-component system, cell cycle sensor histidine kinase and response regulator CckA